MVDVWSVRTKTLVGSTLVQEKDIDPYPDRVASTNAVTTATSTVMVSDAGSTTDDISALFKWEPGDKLYGTHAKTHAGMSGYMRDINEAYGNEGNYNSNVIFVDTTKSVGEQLKNLR